MHLLASHPTPPVFDGPEDRNGLRNHDEIRLRADYVTPGAADYPYDDAGRLGGLAAGSRFVIAGDQNADPLDGDSVAAAIDQLLRNPLINTETTPSSPGGGEQSGLQGGVNDAHRSNPSFDTADFADTRPGNCAPTTPCPTPARSSPTGRPLAAGRRPALRTGRHLPLPVLRPPPDDVGRHRPYVAMTRPSASTGGSLRVA